MVKNNFNETLDNDLHFDNDLYSKIKTAKAYFALQKCV